MARQALVGRGDRLKPVIILARPRPKTGKDTVEYNMENMHLQIHATVEDMLSRLLAYVSTRTERSTIRARILINCW